MNFISLERKNVTWLFYQQFFEYLQFAIIGMQNQCSQQLNFSGFHPIGKYLKFSLNLTFGWECMREVSLPRHRISLHMRNVYTISCNLGILSVDTVFTIQYENRFQKFIIHCKFTMSSRVDYVKTILRSITVNFSVSNVFAALP